MQKLSFRIKFLYGLGFSSRGIKDGLFQLFLFFYFSQLLGLDAALAGTASLIALLFDAVSDPLIGWLSDRHRSERWGRRHPFMLASALPLAVFTYLLFAPPSDLSQMGLFYWLTVFSILVRLALTLFIVPHMSLGAEMTTHYDERTSVTAFRIMFAAFVAPVIIILGLGVFFTPEEGMTNGLFKLSAYPKFAFVCGILMIVSIVVCVWGTKGLVPGLPKADPSQHHLTLKDVLNDLSMAVRMPSFRRLIGYMMFTYIGLGIGIIFTTYFITYFFALSEKELAFLPIASALGGILALFTAPRMGRRMDKRKAAVVSSLFFGFFFSAPYNLRLLGLFPENGSSLLLPLYLLTLIIAYLFLWVALSLANSMMAEVIDEYEMITAKRQEGLFFATLSFAYKCTTGLGQFMAGILLTVIAFPKQAALAEVPDDAIIGLGYIGGPILLTIYLIAVLFLRGYPIDKARYMEIREYLDAAGLKDPN